MCSAADSGEVIILSDDDDDDIPCSEPSVHIVETEEEKKSGTVVYFTPNSPCCVRAVL